MKRRKAKAPPRSPNLAAKALGLKIFGARALAPNKGYTRKIKHRGNKIIAPPAFSADEADE